MQSNIPVGLSNGVVEQVFRFGADRRGLRWIDSLNNHLQTALSGRDGRFYAGDKGSGQHSYHGAYYGPAPQRFTGAVGLQIFGTQHTNTAGDPQAAALLAAVQGSLQDPSLAAFAGREARRQGGTLADVLSGVITAGLADE